MTFIAAADKRVNELLKAMGIQPEKTRRVVIEINVHDVLVTVTEQYTSIEDVAALTETVRQFKLVPIKEEAEASAAQ